jgi:Leucine-rich repeat (LRR) protein
MRPNEVRRRIQECKKQRLTKLDLGNDWNTPDEEKLTAIPAEIFDFVWLEKLNLRYNQLSELPDSINRLQNLSELDLSDNSLSELPDSITRLQNLSRLDLSFNQLRELPDSITRLQNLSYLNLSRNQLRELPDSISRLQNLSKLYLRNNQLSELPDFISLLQNLSQLDLSSNQLSEFPDSISRLQNLSLLYLRNNQLRELPDSITHLQNLSSLDLSSNQLSELPDSITRLQNLSLLSLSSSQLSELPDSITRLQNLSQLDLSDNQLSGLPDSITRLQNLSQLNLSSNQLIELPDSISLLQNLSLLYLANNKLSELPDSIGNLQNLSQLDLNSNQLSELPDSISLLQNLSQLDLRENQLSELPDSISLLQNLSILYLRNNPLINPPPEIANQGIEAIHEYFRERAEEGEDTLYEAKLIIIGEGGAGKTTLARKILNPDAPMPKAEETTKGIDVLEWHFLMENDQDFRVNIWDFGGQEIYHATHQFFLTKRSLYLLVVDSRKEHPHLDYWLNIVELFSENSPLLVVKNELGDRPVKMDEPQLKGRFENLKESLPTNLGKPQGGSGLEAIKKAIIYHISQLSHIGNSLPKTWIQVRETLEQDERNYISLEQYLQICDQNGFKLKQESVTDGRLVLSQYFHDLGSILHFQEDQTSPLYKTVILKPKWGTDAAYKVLDNNQVKQNLGKFTTTELKQIWQDVEYRNMQSELLELMLKFKLCYPLPNAKNTYIAPQLLDANQPKYSWNDTDNLLLRYEYDFMPRGILTRFIVEMHKYINEPNVWLTGVLLKRDDSWAEVIETYDRREIKIRLSGTNKRGFLEVITDQLDEIHDSFKQLKVKKLIPCNCDVCKDSQNPHFYDLNKLRERLANRKDDIECDKPPYNQANVLSLIDDIGNREKLIYTPKEHDFKVNHTTINNYGTIQDLDLQQGNNTMTEKSPDSKPIKVKSAWANGSFYLFVFVVVVAGIGFLGKQLDFIVLCVVVIAGVLFIPLIGALQLKQDDRLKDESFVALMKMVIGSLPLIGNPLRGILNPQKEDKN